MKNFLKYIIPAVLVGIIVSGVAVAQVTNPNYWKLISNTIQPILNSYGFKVGNFTVDTSGNATTSNLSVTGTCTGCGVSSSRTISTTAPLQGGGDLSANRTFSITQASSTANGYLTSTDWSTFNGKQNALGFTPEQVLTFNSPLSRSVNTISLPKASSTADGYLSQTDWSTFNNKQNTITTGNFSESTSSVLTVTGGTGAILGNGLTVQVKQASSTQSGYLSSTDWSTFNGKVSSQWATNGSNISFTGGNVGIGTTTPTQALSVIGNIFIPSANVLDIGTGSGLSSGGSNIIKVGNGTAGDITGNVQAAGYYAQGGNISINYYQAGIGLGNATPLTFSSTASSNGSIDTGISRGAAGKLYVGNGTQGDFTGTLIASNVGIGTTSPAVKLDIVANNTEGMRLLSGNSAWLTYLAVGRTSDEIQFGVAGSAGQFFNDTVQGDTVLKNLGSGSIHLGVGSAASTMVLTNAGNVGIGTTGPQTKLQVNGQIYANNIGGLELSLNNQGTNFAQFYDPGFSGSNGGIALGGASTITGTPASATMFWNVNNGNVGIGTTSPGSALTFASSTSATGGINFGDASADLYRIAAAVIKTDGGLIIGSTGIAGQGANVSIENAGSYGVTTNGQSATLVGALTNNANKYATTLTNNTVMVETSGNNGLATLIGTFGPTSGNGTFNMLQTNGTISQTGSATGTSRSIYINPVITSVVDYRSLEIAPLTVNLSTSTAATVTVASILINPLTYTTASSTAYNIATSSTFNISGVPIGTTSTTLTTAIGSYIQGGTAASTTNAYAEYVVAPTGATNNYAAIFTGGNVGIGTATPSEILNVYGNVAGNVTMRVENHSVNGFESLDFYNETGTRVLTFAHSNTSAAVLPASSWIGTRNAEPLYFVTNGTSPRLTIDSTGNVGIGTTSPTTKLFIQNAAGAADIFAIASSSGITLMKIDAQGNLNVPHIIGNTATPTIATSTGAGASATSTIAGTDLSGLIQVNTFSADTPSASADIVTITFNKAYGSAPYCTIVPANDATWNLAYGIWRYRQSDTTTTIFKIRSGGTPLPATTNAVYAFIYRCTQ